MSNLSKVYRGYVIENVGNAWLIHNFPSWTNTNAMSPGPHPSYFTATHQVDKLVEYLNRNNSNSAKPTAKPKESFVETVQPLPQDNDELNIFQYIIVWGLLLLLFILTASL